MYNTGGMHSRVSYNISKLPIVYPASLLHSVRRLGIITKSILSYREPAIFRGITTSTRTSLVISTATICLGLDYLVSLAIALDWLTQTLQTSFVHLQYASRLLVINLVACRSQQTSVKVLILTIQTLNQVIYRNNDMGNIMRSTSTSRAYNMRTRWE